MSHLLKDKEHLVRMAALFAVGLGAFVFKGARIGDGAIVAAGSLVTGPVPPACIAAGTPLRVLRENVAWRRERVAPSLLSPL